ncbi:DMT family transporter [Cohnella thailandensis]|uniref:DMT family transporter n=1 Tax=Cohnella thailandensis TaxID=557557 RepID=A0A841SRQ4_9BACL|nr:DMT family transporter [Cohnella thailandensis]MBB6635063.1 DMT family transporter [Cohnella thailandensis]MBP1977874.1 drug/metabolite transporter (DMT)-like permease [Cohnella thailandensis]
MERWKGMLCLFGAFSLAGSSVISARLLSGQAGTFTIAAVGLLAALLFLLPLCGKEALRTLLRLSRRQWAVLALQALFGMFLFRLFLLYGLQHTSAGEAGILTGATPAVTVLLAYAALKETMDRAKLLGVACTIGGILLIQRWPTAGEAFQASHLLGNVLVLCAAISESLFNILSRFGALKSGSAREEPVSPIVQTTLVTAMAFVLCLIPSLFENPAASLAALGWTEWLAFIWYGPIVTALAFVFWYEGIKRCRATTAAAFSGLMPFTALLLSVLVLGESAGWPQWSGGLLVIAGIVLIGRERRRVRGITVATEATRGSRAVRQER